MRYSHIIWDWNGTLLDDVELCFTCINILLLNRSKPPIKDIREYRNLFGFPVIDYYRRVGFDFDKEPFEIPAAEFIKLYHSDDNRFHLFKGAMETLSKIGMMGIKQAVLSASEIGNLRLQTELLGVEHYFDDIIGISNIYAESKKDMGRAYIEGRNPDRKSILLVGDTVHDFDVANALGIDCVLVANGHQGREKLLGCGIPILTDITDIFESIK